MDVLTSLQTNIPGGMQFAARRSEGISLPSVTSHGLAPWAASLRILDPEISMKSSGRDMSLAFMT